MLFLFFLLYNFEAKASAHTLLHQMSKCLSSHERCPPPGIGSPTGLSSGSSTCHHSLSDPGYSELLWPPGCQCWPDVHVQGHQHHPETLDGGNHSRNHVWLVTGNKTNSTSEWSADSPGVHGNCLPPRGVLRLSVVTVAPSITFSWPQ